MRAAKAARDQQRKTPRDKLFRIKIISMGDMASGKSCLIKRYCEEKYVNKYIPTIGVDYGVKPVRFGDYEVRVNIFDLSGAMDYLEVRNEFYKDAQGAILSYDVTNRASFEALNAWAEEARRYGSQDMVVFVVGTKSDLPNRRVQEQEGRNWATSRGFAFFEASSASGTGVKALFAGLFGRILSTAAFGIPPELASLAMTEAALLTPVDPNDPAMVLNTREFRDVDKKVNILLHPDKMVDMSKWYVMFEKHKSLLPGDARDKMFRLFHKDPELLKKQLVEVFKSINST